MAKEWTRKIGDPSSVELEISLDEIFEGRMLPNSSNLRQAVGQEIIDIIRERTQGDQKSWTGAAFRNYSEEYAESIDFKAYGKSINDPNLTQTGDMLGLMTVKEGNDPGTIIIGWDDSLQSEKAHGHITGNVGVKRDFLGISGEEMEKIRDKFLADLSEQPPTENADEGLGSFLRGERSVGRRSLNGIVDEFFKPDGDDDF